MGRRRTLDRMLYKGLIPTLGEWLDQMTSLSVLRFYDTIILMFPKTPNPMLVFVNMMILQSLIMSKLFPSN